VTFRLRAPNAKEVFVTGIGQRIAMEKNEQGVWSATTDTLKPDIYTYSFSADGVTLNDPANPLFKTSYGSAGSSLVHVPGAGSWEPAQAWPAAPSPAIFTIPQSPVTIATTGSTHPPTTTRNAKRRTRCSTCCMAWATKPVRGSVSARLT
jgi:hypothetical protein